MNSMAVAPSLELHDVRKYYGRTRALNGLNLEIKTGEVLGIAGPNGAGKTTLVRLLSGEESPDGGAMTLGRGTWLPERHAVAVVHQEPRLFPNLTLAENVLLGHERFLLGKATLDEREAAILDELGIRRHARTVLAECSLVVRQLTAIARALAYDAEVFLFDEPNSALTEQESDHLFEQMHALVARRRFVVLVSHRLAELVAHAGRVAIIREGRCAGVLGGKDLTEQAIAQQLVIGDTEQESADRLARARRGSAQNVLQLQGWSHARRAFEKVDLTVAQGEIVALVGVEGSGTRELLASIAGLEPAQGSIRVDGFGGIHDVRRVVSFLPADRHSSLFRNFSVAQNLVARLGRPLIAGPLGYLRTRRLVRLAAELIARFRVRADSPRQSITSLSGGNQQKVAIAAAIARKPRLLALEEPTRGVDIGSKAEIYRLLSSYATEGNGVLVFCTEIPEVFELADRVVVLDRGRVVGIREVGAYSDVASLASGLTAFKHHLVKETSGPV
jgi:ABC-type sugar transport system ATPase subunit